LFEILLGENPNIFENNIIIVKAAMVLWSFDSSGFPLGIWHTCPLAITPPPHDPTDSSHSPTQWGPNAVSAWKFLDLHMIST